MSTLAKWEVIEGHGTFHEHLIIGSLPSKELETDDLELAHVVCEFLNQREAQLAKPGINEEETE